MSEEIISTPPQELSEPGWTAAEEQDELESASERRSFLVSAEEHGLRIDKLLAQRCPEFSRSHFQHLLQDGAVQLGSRVLAKASAKVRVGDAVEVELRPTAQAMAFQPERMDLRVVYEDQHLLVIDKPAGLVVHPAAGNWSGTLLNGLLAGQHVGEQRDDLQVAARPAQIGHGDGRHALGADVGRRSDQR